MSTSDRLPPQRELARRLRLNYATVSRAYGEAQRRGLIYSRVGKGTFVCRPRVSQLTRSRGEAMVDMTMNLPPEPEDPRLLERREASLHALAPRLPELLRYQEFGGSPDARRAAVAWLARFSLRPELDRVLVCPGAQGALLAAMSLLAKPGDVVVCEEITYPGVRALATQLGIRLIGLPMDAQGVASDAFEEACAEHHPKLLYLNPTLQNPTTLTIDSERRRALVRCARAHGVAIVEDDAYGALPLTKVPSFAELAPDLTYYITGFAKSLGAGLRVAYMVAPDARRATRLATILRATSVMASPLTVALATQWVEDGTADALLAFVRSESNARQRIAAEVLRGASYRTDPAAFHLWLTLPAGIDEAALARDLQARGLHVAASDSFCVGRSRPSALRVGLGGALRREELRRALEHMAAELAAFGGNALRARVASGE